MNYKNLLAFTDDYREHIDRLIGYTYLDYDNRRNGYHLVDTQGGKIISAIIDKDDCCYTHIVKLKYIDNGSGEEQEALISFPIGVDMKNKVVFRLRKTYEI